MKQPEIIVYGYPASPYFQKIIQTLNFLDLTYRISLQPDRLPRPDFANLGIRYRRIPILSIDGDVYVDTALITQRLCQLSSSLATLLWSHGPSHVIDPELGWEKWGASLFPIGVGLIPKSLDVMSQPTFIADRQDFHSGVTRIYDSREEVLAQFVGACLVLEDILSSRKWISTPSPISSLSSYPSSPSASSSSLQRDARRNTAIDHSIKGRQRMGMGDIHASFVAAWVIRGHRGAPEITRDEFPRVWDWLDRIAKTVPRRPFRYIEWEEVKVVLLRSSRVAYPGLLLPKRGVSHEHPAQKAGKKKDVLEGKKLKEEDRGTFEKEGFSIGETVSIVPYDTGSLHPQSGDLVWIDGREVVVDSIGTIGGARLHFPRLGYRVYRTPLHKSSSL